MATMPSVNAMQVETQSSEPRRTSRFVAPRRRESAGDFLRRLASKALRRLSHLIAPARHRVEVSAQPAAHVRDDAAAGAESAGRVELKSIEHLKADEVVPAYSAVDEQAPGQWLPDGVHELKEA